MPTHEAPAQMLGYLYQVRYALLLLLENENPNAKICIEKFDDISFEDDGSPIELIQTKHHINAQGNLTDNSVDLWKTIKVWLDVLDEHPELLGSCRFVIVTSAKVPDNSAAKYLKRRNRDEEKAYHMLKTVAESSINQLLKGFFNKFQKTSKTTLLSLFKSCEIIDNEPVITDLEKRLLHRIRLSCYRGYEDKVLEQLEGWWCQCVLKSLTSEEHLYLDYYSLQNKTAQIGQQYQPDNLPIEDWVVSEISEEDLFQDQRVFIQQLRLINANNSMLRRAIKNYYRAYMQRSSWTREELLLPNELEEYEKRLIDEWEEAQSYYEEGDNKLLSGQKLYKELMNKEINIRKLCTEPFVMRGSYQILSDRKEIGWHRDFLEKLKELVEV